jgi:AraC-like DNA-binding protein
MVLDMVKTGHVTLPPMTEYRFNNPDVNVGLEVLGLDSLRQRLSPDARAALHRADFHQLFVVTSGTVDAVVDCEALRCGRKTVLHVRPRQVMCLPVPHRAESAAIAILFTPYFPQRLPLLESVLGSFGASIYEIPPTAGAALATAATELRRTYADSLRSTPDSPDSSALLRQMLGVVLLRLAMASQRSGDQSDAANVETVRRFRVELERSFATSRAASTYAHRVGYSARTLNRACVSVTGCTAKQIIDARVALEAKRLLAYTDVPSSTIARRLGFSEATNFAKFFAREASVTPGAFRLANQSFAHTRSGQRASTGPE